MCTKRYRRSTTCSNTGGIQPLWNVTCGNSDSVRRTCSTEVSANAPRLNGASVRRQSRSGRSALERVHDHVRRAVERRVARRCSWQMRVRGGVRGSSRPPPCTLQAGGEPEHLDEVEEPGRRHGCSDMPETCIPARTSRRGRRRAGEPLQRFWGCWAVSAVGAGAATATGAAGW